MLKDIWEHSKLSNNDLKYSISIVSTILFGSVLVICGHMVIVHHCDVIEKYTAKMGYSSKPIYHYHCLQNRTFDTYWHFDSMDLTDSNPGYISSYLQRLNTLCLTVGQVVKWYILAVNINSSRWSWSEHF